MLPYDSRTQKRNLNFFFWQKFLTLIIVCSSVGYVSKKKMHKFAESQILCEEITRCFFEVLRTCTQHTKKVPSCAFANILRGALNT